MPPRELASPPLHPDDWTPVGVDGLEPAAEVAVRSHGNTLVVAGPGAGKTELLAQRASFLLQAGGCRAPKRILAISFKRDAAKNLGDRVDERCADDARRFDSMTLDAFAKGIVDRFLLALPQGWRPSSDYRVRLASLSPDDARLWLAQAPLPAHVARPNVEAADRQKVRMTMDRVMFGAELPYDAPDVHPLLRAWGCQWWKEQLRPVSY